MTATPHLAPSSTPREISLPLAGLLLGFNLLGLCWLLWKYVPAQAMFLAEFEPQLSWATSWVISLSNWFVRLLPLIVVSLTLLLPLLWKRLGSRFSANALVSVTVATFLLSAGVVLVMYRAVEPIVEQYSYAWSPDASLDALITDLNRAHGARDGDAVAALFHDEGAFSAVAGRVERGRDSIRGALGRWYADEVSAEPVNFSTASIDRITPDVALVEASGEISDEGVASQRVVFTAIRTLSGWSIADLTAIDTADSE